MLHGVDCKHSETDKIYTVSLEKFLAAIRERLPTRLSGGGAQPPTAQALHESEDAMSRESASQYDGSGSRHSTALIEMWKSLGKALKQPAYAGEGNPNLLNAWQEDVEMFLRVYNVIGEAQVLAAARFLQGEAEEWWTGLQATGRHRQIQTLEQLCQELKKEILPTRLP